MSKPKVSVLCLAYNQKSYIHQAVDSMLMQKTDFEFEILINDDASTDGTREILKQYQQEHPDIVRLVLQKENQFSKGLRNFMFRYLLPKARGKYIAICEGDDYWTDEYKLQRQVDFMETHPSYSICFHPVRIITEGSNLTNIYPAKRASKIFTVKELLKNNFIQTNSVVYRNYKKYSTVPDNILPADWYLHLYHAQFGKIGFIDRVMSVYRRHPGGIWWESDKNKNKFWASNGPAHLRFYDRLSHMFGDNARHREIISNNAANAFKEIRLADKEMYIKLLVQYPEFAAVYSDNMADRLYRLEEHGKAQGKHINHLENELQMAQNEVIRLNSTLSRRLKRQVKRIIK